MRGGEMVASNGLNASFSPSLLLNQKQPPKQWGVMKPLSVAGPTEVDIQRNKEFKCFSLTVTEPKAATKAVGVMKPLSVAGPTEADIQINKKLKHIPFTFT
ncbi:Polynucleotide adenylyltransferase [Forsythia ovata]|uniref:Polynucleotide adenylyltransferase n=1 Tax=Forsythia ovata TaxID=205694 RepID=A0ABD1WLM7_9LAMI